MLRRTFSAVGVVLAVCLFAVFCRSGASSTAPAEFGEVEREPEVLATPEVQRAQTDTSAGPMRVFDALTGEELKCGVQILTANDEPCAVASGEVVDLYAVDSDADIRLDLLEDSTAVPVADACVWTGREWHSTLPFNAGLNIRVVNLPPGEMEMRGMFYLFPHPDSLTASSSVGGGSSAFDFMAPTMTLFGKVKWLYRKGALKPIFQTPADDHGSAEFVQPLAGKFVVMWLDREGNQAFAEANLEPGAATEVVMPYAPRPHLAGRILDWNGEPVPGALVKSIIVLDQADYDFLPQDPHAFGAIRRDGVGLIHTIEQFYKTDDFGRFACRIPRGSEYAVQSCAMGSYAFWSTITDGPQPPDAMYVELTLAQPSEPNTLRLRVHDALGNPLRQALVCVSLVGDVPFMRQWDEARTDDEGVAKFVGLVSGQRIGVTVQHPSLENGMSMSRTVVPADLAIEVDLRPSRPKAGAPTE